MNLIVIERQKVISNGLPREATEYHIRRALVYIKILQFYMIFFFICAHMHSN